jgi:hypothetical protein
MAKAKSNVCNDSTNRCNEIKPGAGDKNRTRVLSLGIYGSFEVTVSKSLDQTGEIVG